jgi:hypothetical protein
MELPNKTNNGEEKEEDELEGDGRKVARVSATGEDRWEEKRREERELRKKNGGGGESRRRK